MSSHSTPLLYQTLEPTAVAARSGEPVTCGVPWPAGALGSDRQPRLVDATGDELPLQWRVLDRWPDGSARWTLLDWLADSGTEVRVEVVARRERSEPSGPLACSEGDDGSVTVETGEATFRLSPGDALPFASVEVGGREVIDAGRSGLTARDDADCSYQGRIDLVEIEESGPVRVTVRLDGRVAAPGGSRLLELSTRLDFFRRSSVVRLDLGLTNPRGAGHPGGIWSLGNDGSVYLRDLSLSVAVAAGEGEATLALSTEPGRPLARAESPVEIYQASSGGELWNSSAHVDRHGELPLPFRGYRVDCGGRREEGLRAAPLLELRRGSSGLAISIPQLWQNFPKALEAGEAGIIVRLFPRQQRTTHEIQGGERKTHTLYLAFGDDEITEAPLEWTRAPLLAHPPPEWYAASGALPELTTEARDPNGGYLQLVHLALDGDDTFERKREAVDEYGWRHFGDLWADHEAARHDAEEPLISHYNNQYDMVGGMATHFMRSGDGRWHRHMRELARHVVDIDIYHTDQDKSAYCGGMFWHTVHYVDAGTSTHRSYPQAEGVPGGGPSTGHLYADGLRLHYLLTGDRDSRDAVIGLGDYVIDADDGSRTVFRFLDRHPTGHVSNSGFDDYHGPGRSGANAIATLVAAHKLSGDDRFLGKAEELVRRCIHPDDDLDALDLLDADRKWFYTMFLQSLGGYLEHKIELGRLDEHYAYGRAALRHYARWAAEHEYPYLEKPEILEFPTETWAAQDMRKSELFLFATRHAADETSRERFLERSRYFFDASVERLAGEPTRSYTRPVALLLSNGWRRAWFDLHEVEPAPEPTARTSDFGAPQVFISQKRRALRRAKRLLVAVWALAVLGLGATALTLWLGGS